MFSLPDTLCSVLSNAVYQVGKNKSTDIYEFHNKHLKNLSAWNTGIAEKHIHGKIPLLLSELPDIEGGICCGALLQREL